MWKINVIKLVKKLYIILYYQKYKFEKKKSFLIVSYCFIDDGL